ncbi:hypothetical protein [Pseudalkalibacillus caeni]|uniref:Uncharacterized protein n=1 Tax=Exobacillus caeni TaxID=2574798 RepID=A0A5R9F2X0_9BACL|nr:hypothetical protein [Pseudalkalibacillus caeni]TLS36666.1 hypothetical protein FCL54_14190 [Pseudalkalibacillus caeni]
MDRLNERLGKLQEQQRVHKKWSAKRKLIKQNLTEERERLDIFKEKLEKENLDVEKLHKISVTNLLYTLLGTKEDRLDREKQEAAAAKLKYDEAAFSVKKMEKELETCRMQLEKHPDPEKEYAELLKEKEKLIADKNSPLSRELYEVIEMENHYEKSLKEINEALAEGDEALNALQQVVDALHKAGNWGTIDMIGGGAITTALKHNQMDQAKILMHEAQYKLKQFQSELNEVGETGSVRMDKFNFLHVADYVFDGFIVDWLVQGKIHESKRQATSQADTVSEAISLLKREKQKAEQALQTTKEKRLEMVKKA